MLENQIVEFHGMKLLVSFFHTPSEHPSFQSPGQDERFEITEAFHNGCSVYDFLIHFDLIDVLESEISKLMNDRKNEAKMWMTY